MKKVILIKIGTLLDSLCAGWIFLVATSFSSQSLQGLIISIVLAILCFAGSISITLALKEYV